MSEPGAAMADTDDEDEIDEPQSNGRRLARTGQGKIIADPELQAMHAMQKAMDTLEPPVQERVLSWLNARFGTPVANGIHH